MRIRGNGWVKIAGVICEYNPFHNGHQRHLRLTRERSGCDYIVCCMAGAFTQRGELAIVDKFLRAEMALRCGADAVVELLRPIREETDRLLHDKAYLESVYRDGAQRAQRLAGKTLSKVQRKIGFIAR